MIQCMHEFIGVRDLLREASCLKSHGTNRLFFFFFLIWGYSSSYSSKQQYIRWRIRRSVYLLLYTYVMMGSINLWTRTKTFAIGYRVALERPHIRKFPLSAIFSVFYLSVYIRTYVYPLGNEKIKEIYSYSLPGIPAACRWYTAVVVPL